jgi:hypothetical protein
LDAGKPKRKDEEIMVITALTAAAVAAHAALHAGAHVTVVAAPVFTTAAVVTATTVAVDAAIATAIAGEGARKLVSCLFTPEGREALKKAIFSLPLHTFQKVLEAIARSATALAAFLQSVDKDLREAGHTAWLLAKARADILAELRAQGYSI